MGTNTDHENSAAHRCESDERRSSNPISTSDGALPFPPRFWWLKRILAASTCLIIAVIVLGWWWNGHAKRILEAWIAEYRALGQPVSLDDYRCRPIPDEENAAYYLKLAIEKNSMSEDESVEISRFAADLDEVREHPDDVRLKLETKRDVFELVAKAAACEKSSWNMPLTSLVLASFDHKQLFAIRDLSELHVISAYYELLLGNDRLAIDRVGQSLYLAECVAEENWFLISHLNACARVAHSVSAIEEILPELQIEPAVDDSSRTTVFQIRDLIDRLLDESRLRESIQRSIHGERFMELDAGQCALSAPNSLINNPSSILLRFLMFFLDPILRCDTVRLMDISTHTAQAAASDRYDLAASRMPACVPPQYGIESHVCPLSKIMIPCYERGMVIHYRCLAFRRMAAIALAIRLYEIDHGRRPATLEELTPDYLTNIPRDPFDPQGGTVRYAPQAEHPLLYCLDENMLDDRGVINLSEYGGLLPNNPDLLFFLDGQRPLSRLRSSSTQVAEPDEQEENIEDDEAESHSIEE